MSREWAGGRIGDAGGGFSAHEQLLAVLRVILLGAQACVNFQVASNLQAKKGARSRRLFHSCNHSHQRDGGTRISPPALGLHALAAGTELQILAHAHPHFREFRAAADHRDAIGRDARIGLAEQVGDFLLRSNTRN
jgi:hypothetical protein